MRRRFMVPLSELSQGPPAGMATGAAGAPGPGPARPARAWRRAGVILGCAALLATGCASAGGAGGGQPAVAAPTAQPSAAAPAGPAVSQAQLKLAARRYVAIARPANRRLDADFDGLDELNRGRLADVQADLRDAVATEHLFDRQLLRITLPPATEAVARLLVTANQARARLTAAAATCTSVRQLRQYKGRLTAASAPVEEAVRVIRSQLGLPAPDTS